MARVGLTAERLTEAAAQLADEAGLAGLTMSALARRLGITDPGLYAHVASLAGLRVRVAALALTELADRVADALAGRAGRDALLAFADTYRDYATAHPGRYAAIQTAYDGADEVVVPARRHADLTRALLRAYGLAEPDQTDAVRLVHAFFHGYVTLESSGGFAHHPRSADASWRRSVDALDVLLRSWPPGAAGAG